MPTDRTVTLNRRTVQQQAQISGALAGGATATSALVQFPGAAPGYVVPSETERDQLTQVPVTRPAICVATPPYPANSNSNLPPPDDPQNPFTNATAIVGKGLTFWPMMLAAAYPPAQAGPAPDNVAPWFTWSQGDGVLTLPHFRGDLEIKLEASGVETDRNSTVVLFGVQTSLDGVSWTLAPPLLARRLFTTISAPSPVHYAVTLPHVRNTMYRVVACREQALPGTMAMIATDARLTFTLQITEPY